MRVLGFMALRALLRSPLSLTLLLAAVGAGVAFQIPNAANINGYTEELLRQGVARGSGDLLVTAPPAKAVADARRTTARLARLPFVRAVTARIVRAGVLFRQGGYLAVRAVGIDLAAEQRASGFCDRLARGRCDPSSAAARGKVIVGSRLAEKLGLEVGQRVKLVVPWEELDEVHIARQRFTVGGVMRGGGGFSADYDLFLPIEELGQMLRVRDEATELSIYVDDRERAADYLPAVAQQVAPATVEPWWQANSFVASAIAGNQALFAISTVMVIVAVGIPVLALLYIHVLQERRQTAILAAIGFSRGDLFAVHLIKAGIIGTAGTAIGIGLGLALCALFRAHPIFAHAGFIVRPALNATAVAAPAGIIFAVTLLAGIAPAVSASRADPAAELRKE